MPPLAVYFFCPEGTTPENQRYSFATVCLTEGLKALGVECNSLCNYWKGGLDDCFLLSPIRGQDYSDADIVVVDAEWFSDGRMLPQGLFRKHRRYKTILLDYGDRSYATRPECRNFDIIYRTHFQRRLKYPANVRPAGFGFCSRFLRLIKTSLNGGPIYKIPRVLQNYRHGSTAHPVRVRAQRAFVPLLARNLAFDETTEPMHVPPSDPYDFLMWCQTGRRHHRNYVNRLLSSVANMCFCGFFVSGVSSDQESLLFRLARRLLSSAEVHTYTIQQWDSWRLWETWAAGAAVIHVDLERYGCVLPVMPENGVHYVGVDLRNPETSMKICGSIALLDRVALAGRTWALNHYAPVPVARRLLADCGYEPLRVEALGTASQMRSSE